MATAELRSLSLYRNGTKAGVIPIGKMSTKISGLALDTEYTFHLVLRTSAGQYSSERLTVRTHKMTDLSGITVTPGIMPQQLKDSLLDTVDKIGAKVAENVRIDTTHFVCTEPRGANWEKAVEMNVPVVVPDWIKGCEREGRIVGVRGYYLDANPKDRQVGSAMTGQGSGSAQRPSISAPVRESPRIEHTPPTPERPTREERLGPQNGAEPPTPPGKPANERLAEQQRSASPSPRRGSPGRETDSASAAGYSMAGTTVVEADGSDSEDSDNDTEKGEEKSAERAAQQPSGAAGGKTETTDDEAAQIAREDGDGGFDEVAL